MQAVLSGLGFVASALAVLIIHPSMLPSVSFFVYILLGYPSTLMMVQPLLLSVLDGTDLC